MRTGSAKWREGRVYARLHFLIVLRFRFNENYKNVTPESGEAIEYQFHMKVDYCSIVFYFLLNLHKSHHYYPVDKED